MANCISVIDDHYNIEKAEENRKAIEDMANDLSKMFLSNFVYNEWKNGYGTVTKTDKGKTYELFIQLLIKFRESILNIAKVDDHIYLHESLKLIYGAILLVPDKPWNRDFISRVHDLQKEADANIEMIKLNMIAAYWEEHAEEKQQLESEKEELNERLGSLFDRMLNRADSSEIDSLGDEIAALNEQKKALGLFKVKEKKILQEQIDGLKKQYNEAIERYAKPFEEERVFLINRIKEIETELTKER